MSLLKDIKTGISKGFSSFPPQNKLLILQKQSWDFWATQKNFSYNFFKEFWHPDALKMFGRPEISFLLLSLEPSLQWSAQLRPGWSPWREKAKPSPQTSLTWWRVDAPMLHLRPWAPCSFRDFYSVKHIFIMQRSATRCFTILLFYYAKKIHFNYFFSLKLLWSIQIPLYLSAWEITQFMEIVFNYCCWNFCSTVAGEELSTLQIICILDISFYKQK